MTPHHSQHRIGHSLFILGAFSMLIIFTMLFPIANGNTRAFGISDIVIGTNEAREQLNKKPLYSNTALSTAAQTKAEDMAKGRYFAHTAPDGTVAWDYFKKVGYNYALAGENLAITNQSAESIIQGWLDSPTHRDNLLNPDYRDMGIGMAAFGDYQGHKNTYVIVALYGTMASTQLPAAATNPAGGTTEMSSRFFAVSPPYIIGIAALLMIAGIILELRHIKHLHHSKNIA